MLKVTLRNWLLKNPRINPYRFSFKWFLRILTSWLRVYPDIIIIGAGKCGTTSLYDYLIQHPRIRKSWKKEVNYFDIPFSKNRFWYRAHFPTVFTKYVKKCVVIEASPGYLLHPSAARRTKSLIPKIKIIILVRNPTERALSFYNQQLKNKSQSQSFEYAIKNELDFINDGTIDSILNKDFEHSLGTSCILSGGIYSKQITNWLQYFPKERVRIFKTIDLENNTRKVLSDIFEFLEISNYEIEDYGKKNVGNYEPMSKEMKFFLDSFFKPYNDELLSKFGIELDY